MNTEIDLERKQLADSYRDAYEEYLCSDDDRRLTTVTFSSDTPEHVLEDARRAADEIRGEIEDTAGQIPLSDHEREQLDFSSPRVNVPHARSVKGIARDEGVDDWLAHYDPTLTVDEHRDVMQRAAREGGGRRLDSEDSAEVRAGEAVATAQSEECDHARGHCEHGDPSACEFLRDVCGFDDQEISELMEADDEEDLPGRIQGARSQLWTRYQIGLANAKEAAAAINEINQQHGQDLVEFEELGGRALTRADIDWSFNHD